MRPTGTTVTDNGFGIRGVIEGYYGKPWTFAQRCVLLDDLHDLDMNSYFYAAKYDDYHRERWAELYRPDDCEELGRLVTHAISRQVDFWYCIAPGLSLCYADEGDLQRLLNKTEQVYQLGVRCFGLFLDDIPPRLQYPRDAERYASLAEAHVDFIARYTAVLKQRLSEPVRLCVCPWQYCGTGEEPYVVAVGRSLPPEVELLWTGPEVCSRTLETAQAERFIRATGHRPTYWDNYPVNDASMYRDMHLGPLTGRDQTLGGVCGGYLANGMEYFECTRLVLRTIADYLRDPADYDPETSWQAALTAMLGKAAPAFLPFADNMRRSCLQDGNAQVLHEVFFTFRKALVAGQKENAAEILEEYVLGLDELEACIQRGELPAALMGELAPWLAKHRRLHRTARLLVWYLRDPSPAVGRWIWDELAAMKAMTENYADCELELAAGEILRGDGIRE